MKTICIGAGFTGLACGIKTGCTVYEQSDHAGGICTDYVKDGFRFSNGGPHWIFGKDKGLEYIKSLVESKSTSARQVFTIIILSRILFKTSHQKDGQCTHQREQIILRIGLWILLGQINVVCFFILLMKNIQQG